MNWLYAESVGSPPEWTEELQDIAQAPPDFIGDRDSLEKDPDEVVQAWVRGGTLLLCRGMSEFMVLQAC